VSATAKTLAKDGERDPSQLCDRAVMLMSRWAAPGASDRTRSKSHPRPADLSQVQPSVSIASFAFGTGARIARS